MPSLCLYEQHLRGELDRGQESRIKSHWGASVCNMFNAETLFDALKDSGSYCIVAVNL